MTAEQINELFGVSESFKLPSKIMELLFSDEILDIYEKYAEMQIDLSYDGFTNYFQEEHSSRKAMMQDFTPKELAMLSAQLADGNIGTCLDICAGTGGLSIAVHNIAPQCEFFCEELSERAIPLLLFNLAVRNINAYVSNKNVLTGEIIQNYRIAPGERFAQVEKCGDIPDRHVDICITNPPYSLKWEYKEDEKDGRFTEYGYPPKQYADFAFIIHGMSRLKPEGRIVAILPHGVLFRANKEADIRRRMAELGNIHAVIGLPDKLFLNTGIPVAIMIFGKKKQENIIFLDASREYEKNSKQNRLAENNIEKILNTVKNRLEIKKYSHIATQREIIENDYNLNISRYVDTYEPPKPIDIIEVTKQIYECSIEIKRLEQEIYNAICEMSASDSITAAELEIVRQYLGKVAGIE